MYRKSRQHCLAHSKHSVNVTMLGIGNVFITNLCLTATTIAERKPY